MKKRQILVVYLGSAYGGITVYVTNLTRLLKDDASISVLCVNQKLAESLRSMNVPVFGLSFAAEWAKPVQIALTMAMLTYLRIRYQIDTVWINGYSEVILLPYARLLGCRPVATRHLTLDLEATVRSRMWKGRVARALYRKLAVTAEKIICVSGVVAKDIARIASPLKFAVIPNWISFLPEPMDGPRPKGAPLHLLFVGRLQPHKGASLIISAMRQFDADAFSLTIVGEGECLQELKREAAGLNVNFAGFQANTAAFYRTADLFVNPSLGPEGLPLVSLEAMSFGLPCIFSDLPVHQEITDDGNAGLLFRSGDCEDLCAKLAMLLSSPQLLAKYGELGRNRIQTRYNAEAARAQYVEALAL
jgi:glycosyltransferase involved in cell wall biosynthesis